LTIKCFLSINKETQKKKVLENNFLKTIFINQTGLERFMFGKQSDNMQTVDA
jgi:hypothetical protein